MIWAFILDLFAGLAHGIISVFGLFTLPLDFFFIAIHKMAMILTIFRHIFFLDVLWPYVFTVMLIEGAIYGVMTFVKIRGWISGYI